MPILLNYNHAKLHNVNLFSFWVLFQIYVMSGVLSVVFAKEKAIVKQQEASSYR